MSNGNTTFPESYSEICTAIPGDLPCGGNLEYDSAFIMLQSKLQPKMGAEYGDFVETAEPINWVEIERDCLAALRKSKDIRLIIILIRCRLRQRGFQALSDGLSALRYLLTTWPDDLYPQLIEEGEFDPIMRSNALLELDAADGLITDLRNHNLPSAGGISITLKDFEKAHITPREENALPESTVAMLLHEWNERQDKDITALHQAASYLADIKNIIKEPLGEDAPDFARLGALLRLFSSTAQPVSAIASVEEISHIQEQVSDTQLTTVNDDAQVTTVVSPSTTSASPAIATEVNKGINSRSEAMLRLIEVREWFTKTEPSSPAVLILSFAEKTIGKSFSELMKIIPAEMLAQLEIDKE